MSSMAGLRGSVMARIRLRGASGSPANDPSGYQTRAIHQVTRPERCVYQTPASEIHQVFRPLACERSIRLSDHLGLGVGGRLDHIPQYSLVSGCVDVEGLVTSCLSLSACGVRPGRLPAIHQELRRNFKRFRGGLVFKVHRLLYHSTLGSRVIKEKKKMHQVMRPLHPTPQA